MTAHINVGGTNRTVKEAWVNVAGTQRKAKEVWVNVAGTWRKTFSARTVAIIIANYTQMSSGLGGAVYDRITFAINVSDAVTPTSYEWSLAVTTATAIFDGPVYNMSGFTRQVTGTVNATIVVGGQTYYPTLDFTYTAGDEV